MVSYCAARLLLTQPTTRTHCWQIPGSTPEWFIRALTAILGTQ